MHASNISSRRSKHDRDGQMDVSYRELWPEIRDEITQNPLKILEITS